MERKNNLKNLSQTEKTLLALVIKNNGNWENTYDAIVNKEFLEDEEQEELLSPYYNSDVQVITILSEKYPSKLKKISRPPFVLFTLGNLELLKENEQDRLAFLSSFKEEKNDKKVLSKLLKENDKTLVCSYLSYYKEKCIMVVPFGLGNIKESDFQYVVDKGGLLISETPFDCAETEMIGTLNTFRIMSGLANNLLVLSYCRYTDYAVSSFLVNGANIGVVPQSINKISQQQCNKLINDGAVAVYDSVSLQSMF